MLATCRAPAPCVLLEEVGDVEVVAVVEGHRSRRGLHRLDLILILALLGWLAMLERLASLTLLTVAPRGLELRAGVLDRRAAPPGAHVLADPAACAR